MEAVVFQEIWNNRKEFPKIEDLREELCFQDNAAVLKFASNLKRIGVDLIPRGSFAISEELFIDLWNNMENFRSLQDLSFVTGLKPRVISVRACEIRYYLGIEVMPYRGSKHEYGKRMAGF